MKISVVTPTHNPRHLNQVWASLKAQTHEDFEWVVYANGKAPFYFAIPGEDPRIRFVPGAYNGTSIGAVKRLAFSQARGDVVLELDHDDLLAPNALARCADAFSDPDVDFAYSECADFSDPPGQPITYHGPGAVAAWERDGWRFARCDVPENLREFVRVGALPYPVSFEPSALSMSLILYAPNHFRAWRRKFYEEVGGHDCDLPLADDHELLIRTYLAGRMVKIPEVLYFYRVDGSNTWAPNAERIRVQSEANRARYLERLVAREMQLRGLPCVDLGGAHDTPGAPWVPFDKDLPFPDAVPYFGHATTPSYRWTTLDGLWPFPDHSIGAFRAHDFLEHLLNKRLAMTELYRCLAPGGWLLSSTPHARGDGAYQDPTHVSYWVENSFRYYTERHLAKYIGNTEERFLGARIETQDGPIPYVRADLVSLKGDDGRLPMRRGI